MTSLALSRWLLLPFFISGFAALLYQVSWQRLLVLFTGAESHAITTIIAVYLLGMGVGSWLGSRFVDRLSPRQALSRYGLCNLGIAAFALISPWLLNNVLYQGLGSQVQHPVLVGLLIFLSLLWPTTLMGLSLPLVSRAAVVTLQRAPRSLAWLNGINLVGAALGTLISGYWLIGHWGFDGTIFIGAGLSLMAALLGMLLGQASSSAKPTPPAPLSLAQPPKVQRHFYALFFLSGFLAITVELIWLRLLGHWMGSTSYAYAWLLFWFLLFDGIGSLLGIRQAQRNKNPLRVFLVVQILLVLSVLLALIVLPFVQNLSLANGQPTPYVITTALLLHLFGLWLPALLIGWGFPLIHAAAQNDVDRVSSRTSWLEVSNILGNTLAAVVVGFLLFQWIGTRGIVTVITGIALLLAVYLLHQHWPRGWSARSSGFLLIGLLIVGGGLQPSPETLWRMAYKISPDDPVMVQENASGVALFRQRENKSHQLLVNGTHQGNIPVDPTHVAFGLVPALVHPNPEDILIIGLGSGGTAYGAGGNPRTKNIIVIELVDAELPLHQRLLQQQPDPALQLLFRDTRYDIQPGDGRHFLLRTPKRFDMIEADAIYPQNSGAGFLYSREYFEQARQRLKPGGLMAQWRPTPRVENTFVQVFPYTLLLGKHLLIGSNQPIPWHAEALLERLYAADVQAWLQPTRLGPEHARYLVDQVKQPVVGPDVARNINTDFHPRDEYHRNNH